MLIFQQCTVRLILNIRESQKIILDFSIKNPILSDTAWKNYWTMTYNLRWDERKTSSSQDLTSPWKNSSCPWPHIHDPISTTEILFPSFLAVAPRVQPYELVLFSAPCASICPKKISQKTRLCLCDVVSSCVLPFNSPGSQEIWCNYSCDISRFEGHGSNISLAI